MYTLALALIATMPAQPPVKHEDQNPLYKSLLDPGLDVGGKEKVKVPEPTMPDGLNGPKQTAIIKGLIAGPDNKYEYAEFTRNSVNAPQLSPIRDIKGGDPKAPVRGVDVFFVAYGDFKLLEDDKYLDKLTGANKSSGAKGTPLDADALAKRGIKLKPGDEKREGYGTFEFDFLEKVKLSGVGHAMWSRNSESVVAAAEIDPRFLNDKEYPNRWRSISTATGEKKAGEPHPWTGAAMYLKITKLQAPAGAVFIEQHIIFTEPTGWFDGANLLRSKLPIAVQDNVRTMRREFAKGK
jgi:hypothetical protein